MAVPGSDRLRARVLLRSPQRRVEAYQAWENIAIAAPNDVEAWVALGTLLAAADRDAQSLDPERSALGCLDRALTLSPANVPARIALGRVRLDRGEPAAAREAFEAATKTDPRSQEAFARLGDVLLHLATVDRAVPDLPGLKRAGDAYAAALRIHERDAAGFRVHASMGELELARDNAEAALGWFRRQLRYTGDRRARVRIDELEARLPGL